MEKGWILSSNQAMNIVEWEDEFSIYNPLSGETHVINTFPAEILSYIQQNSSMQQPVSSEQISFMIADLSGEAPTPQWQFRIKYVLEQLEEIDLIEFIQ